MNRYTIVIPTKNRPDFLREAVQSALSACRDHDEVVVIDDKGILSALESLASVKDARLKVYINQGTTGCSGARNYGVKQAQNDLIFFLDDDDIICVNYCQYIAEEVKNTHPECQYGFSIFKKLQPNPQDLTYSLSMGQKLSQLPPRERLAGLGVGFWINRTLFEQLEGLSLSLTMNEDTEFCIRLLRQKIEGWYSGKAGALIRVNHQSANNAGHITKSLGYQKRFDNFKQIYEQHQKFLQTVPDVEAFIVQRLLQNAYKSGNFKYATALVMRHQKYPRKALSQLTIATWQIIQAFKSLF